MATFQDEQSLRLVERDCGSLSRGVGVARPSETLRGIVNFGGASLKEPKSFSSAPSTAKVLRREPPD